MTSRFYVGSADEGESGLHDYYVEIFERPDAALYVHASQTVHPDGSTRATVNYCPLHEADGKPFYDQAKSLFESSQTRI